MIAIWHQAAKPFVLRLMAEKISGAERGFGRCRTLAVGSHAGVLVAGVVYHNWSPEAGVMELTMATNNARWLNRTIVREIFDYPFRHVRCQLCVFRVDPGDAAIRRMLRALGGQEYTIPRLRGRDHDEVVVCLTDDAFYGSKFGGEHGQAQSARAA